MSSRLILKHSSQYRFLSSLLRSPTNYSTRNGCVKMLTRLPALLGRVCSTTAHFRRTVTPFSVLSGTSSYRTIPRTVCFIRRHWKQGVTAGTLCAGVALGKMAASETEDTVVSACPHNTCQSQDEAMQHVYIAGQSSYCEATFSHFTLLEKTYVVLRFVYLSILFSPSAILYGISRLFRSSKLESVAWTYTMRALQTAGPAFVKLGQWASTRRDIFSEEFCNSLSQLHSCCHSHQWQDTRRTLEEEFGHDWENILEIADQEPIGSGCVAQVYKGYLKTVKAAETSDLSQGCSESTEKQTTNSLFSRLTHTLSKKSRQRERVESEVAEGPTLVAVKVLHPGTVQAMERDMLLMRYGAYWMDWLNPRCHWVALKECFTEFASVMRRQVTLL